MITHRPRRLRVSPAMRSLVAENHLHAENLILPLFVKEGASSPTPIKNMKGVVQHTFDSLREEVDRALKSGIGGIMVFAIPEKRDEHGSEALNPDGILHTAVRKIREQVGERLVVIADLCLDEFTSHGHCGVLAADGIVDNDATLEIYYTGNLFPDGCPVGAIWSTHAWHERNDGSTSWCHSRGAR